MPKQQGVLETHSDVLTINELPKNKTFYWELASLNFDDNSMQNVVDNIEHNFNVKIHLNLKLKNCRLSGNFDQEHLSTILEIICKSIDAEYVMNGQEIYLRGEGCE
jgi:transmembrane sensor